MKLPLKTSLLSAAFGIAAITSTPASANHVDCNSYLDNFVPEASACVGFFDGNALGGNSGDLAIQQDAIDQLLGPGFDLDDLTKIEGPADDTTLDFGMALIGDVVVGIHFGGAQGQANNVDNGTGFFLFHFDTPTTGITTTIPGFSAMVFTPGGPAVPEPGTWAMMLMGFGAAGYAMRRRRRSAELPQVA
jgi:hypothetical protein